MVAVEVTTNMEKKDGESVEDSREFKLTEMASYTESSQLEER